MSLRFTWLGVLALALAASTAGQPATPPASAAAPTTQAAGESVTTADLSPDGLDARIQQIEASGELPEKLRGEIVGLYKQAREQLVAAQTWQSKAAEFARLIREAPADLEAARNQPPASTRPARSDQPVEQISAELAATEVRLRTEQESLRKLDTEADNRDQRRRSLPDLLTAATQRREEAAREPGAAAGPAADPQLDVARRALQQCRLQAIDAEMRAYQQEQAFYAARGDVLTLRREAARAAVRALQEEAAAWQSALSNAREQEIARQRAQAEQELQRAPQVVREVARRNAELAELRNALTPRIAAARERVRVVSESQERMSATARRLQKDAELVGVSAYLGQRLRQAMSDLDTVRDLPTQIQRTRRELDESAALAWQIRQEREDLPPLEDAVRDATAAVAVDMSPGARERLRGVFVTQRELLDRLMADYDELATQLSALLTAQSGFESQIDELSDFVAENVLWVRSSVPLTSSRPPSDWRRLPDQLARLALVYLGDMLTHPTTDLAAAVFLLGLAAARRRLRAQMNDLAQRVSSAYTDRYRYTWAAAVLTVLLAVPIPLLLWYLAWRVPGLSTNSDSDALAAALGFGCARAALVVVMFSLIQQVCRPAGLGESHFRWDRSDLRLVRREVGWLKWITGPVVLVVATCELLPDEGWRDWVGRIAWLGGMAALPIFAQRVLHPQRGLGAARPARARATLFDRTRAYWYWFGLLFPGVLAVLSIVGYQYTAISLLRLIVRTVWLMLGLVLLQSLLVRWLFVAQRRIALEQARRRAAEVQNQPAESSERPPVDDEKLNLVSLGDQTRQLLRSAVATGFVIGLWLIWNDALPALKILDAVQIGSYAVETAVPGPDGVARTVSTVQRVTLNHAALAVVISFVTFLLARNIPALIEIILLQKLPIDAGGRYAVTAIARYAITILGVLTAFSAVGVGWSQVQWLAAAVSVGLGFGLQEIFANFVSGLMLLFERPIRIGDTVTVGNVTGVVTRIRIRATTITDWDRKDLIIPNREFITGQVINWTLTDSTLRLVIPVGVAYGTEPARVERELLAAARRERLVLDDPPPRVVFTSFGESSLNFELRVFTTVDNVVDTRHALMQSLNEALQKAGIEIAYPQREVRIRNETPAPASGMAAPAAAAKASGMS